MRLVRESRYRIEQQLWHYHYDAWGRLAEIKDDDGGVPDEVVATYKYDAAGRRIRKLTGDPGAPTNTYDYFFNNAWQIVEVRKDGLTEANLYEQFVWSLRYIDSPILRDRDAVPETGDLGKSGSGLDERLYYTTDANMNVTALVDTDGAVVERYVYDAYGKATIYEADWSDEVDWDDSKKNEILYCGYRYDPESNMYQVRNRYYHPTLGRWAQRDPGGYVDGMNLYEYVRSSPVGYVDPDGSETLDYDAEIAAEEARIAGQSPNTQEGTLAARTTTPPAATRPSSQPAGRGNTCGIRIKRSAICKIFGQKKPSDFGHEWIEMPGGAGGVSYVDHPSGGRDQPYITAKKNGHDCHRYERTHPMWIWKAHVRFFGGSLPNRKSCGKASCSEISECMLAAMDKARRERMPYRFKGSNCIDFVNIVLSRCCMARGVLPTRIPWPFEELRSCCEREKDMDSMPGCNTYGRGPS